VVLQQRPAVCTLYFDINRNTKMVNQKWVNASIINNILYFAYFPYIILYAAKTIDTHVHALYYNNNNISHII